MPSAEGTAVRRFLALGVAAVALAGALSVGLDESAERRRQVERVRGWCRVVGQLAGAERVSGGDHGGSSLGRLLGVLVSTEPSLSFVRVEAGDGRVLGQAGDAERSERWEDRTFALEGGPVRVRAGYRGATQPLGLAVRAILWALLVGALWLLGAAVVAWSLRPSRR